MHGRRTLVIAVTVALFALAASVGIAGLHRRAGERQDRYEQLIGLGADANRIDALESQANADRRVPLAAQAEVTRRLAGMSDNLLDLVDRETVGAASVRDLFERYRPQIAEEFA